uniref:Factor of DNA methylation 1-like n=1 Tax=Tanacetum cinerariifolium TaxID=118510 RepID=A0A699H5J1_TANCI|nr:factor of DNA methylation 1-like [Tanacetum cinerariifolium]
MTTTTAQQVTFDNALFWFANDKKDSTSYRFKIDKKRYRIDMEVFREILQICPRLPNQVFDALPSDEEIVSYIKELRHKLDIKFVSDVSSNSIRDVYKRNVDFVEQLWEDFTFQIEKRDTKKQEKMYYLRFTKAIIHHFISKDTMRNKMFMHTAQDDSILVLMRFVSKADDYQVYGALLHEIPNEPKGKSIDTHKGTSFKPEVPNVSKVDSSESEYESWGDNGDEDSEYKQDDEKDALENEESEDAFIHTSEDYVPTDDETNDETKDVDEKEYERISEELYGHFNGKLTNSEHNDEENGDADMTNDAHVQVEHTQEQTTGVQEESGLEIASIQVISTIKSEVPDVVKEYLGSSLNDALYKMIQKHSADIIKEHSVLAEIVERLKQQHAPHKSFEDIQKIKMEHARKQQMEYSSGEESKLSESKIFEYKDKPYEQLRNGTYKVKYPNGILKCPLCAGKKKQNFKHKDLHQHASGVSKEFDQKTTLFNTMTKSKSFNKSPKHKALYHALMESILEDEDDMDKGVTGELKKRKPDDDDSSKGKFLTTSSKSGKSAKEQDEEPIFVQDSDYAKHYDVEFDNFDMLMDQGEDLGKTDEQPNYEAVPNNDWYKKSISDTSLDPE